MKENSGDIPEVKIFLKSTQEHSNTQEITLNLKVQGLLSVGSKITMSSVP